MDSPIQIAVPAVEQLATPPCPHFGLCGGCQLQHLAYSAQLERKAHRLQQLLSSFPTPELQLHRSTPLGYRNRIRLTLRTVDGELRAGYLARSAGGADAPNLDETPDEESADATFLERGEMRGGIEFLPINECPIAAPVLWRAAEAFLALANNVPWLRAADLAPDQLELFCTAEESKVQLTLFVRASRRNPPAPLASDLTALCESLRARIPELAGAGVAFLRPATRTRLAEQPRRGPAWGSPGMTYALRQLAPRASVEPRTSNLEPLSYWVPRGAFFQVNRFLLPELVNFVTQIAATQHERALAWDLYAGVGLFSRALARAYAHVTAVEVAEPATSALAQAKLSNLRAVKATTLDFLRSAVVQRDRPSFVVLDPPRTGLGGDVCSLLSRIAAPMLVYVSCSPRALAIDLARLTSSGYAIHQLHLFDLFPQTTHIETVAVLARCR